MVLAHRLAWEFANGPLPDGEGYHGLCVCHTCDNGGRGCVNPAHMFLGTHADNMRDKADKSRACRMKGQTKGNSKLVEHDVIGIRLLGQTTEMTPGEIAAHFGVSRVQICNILAGRQWRHV
jgi:hypothetical protein